MGAHMLALLSLLTTVSGQVEAVGEQVFLGVALTEIEEPLAAHLGVEGGALVVHVVPGSPADGALRAHDAIVGLGDAPIRSPAAFVEAIHSHQPGDVVRLVVRRGGEVQVIVVEVTLGTREVPSSEPPLPERPAPPRKKRVRGFLGVGYGSVPEVLAVHLRLEGRRGVVVGDVLDESPADKAGLSKHDVLLTIDGSEIQGASDFVRLLQERHAGDELVLGLFHAGERKEVAVVLGERPEQRGRFAPRRGRFYRGWDEPRELQDERSRFRGSLRLRGPDGETHEFEIPDVVAEAEALSEELKQHLKRFEGSFSLDELQGQLRDLLEGFELDGDFGIDLNLGPDVLHFFGEREGQERIELKTRQGDREITVLRENGEISIKIDDDGTVLEGISPDHLDVLEPEVRAEVEALLKKLSSHREPSHREPSHREPGKHRPTAPRRVLPHEGEAVEI